MKNQNFYDVHVSFLCRTRSSLMLVNAQYHLPADDATQAIDFAIPKAEISAKEDRLSIIHYTDIRTEKYISPLPPISA